MDECLKFIALIEKPGRFLYVAETEAEEVIDQVWVVLAVLSRFKHLTVSVADDELECFFE